MVRFDQITMTTSSYVEIFLGHVSSHPYLLEMVQQILQHSLPISVREQLYSCPFISSNHVTSLVTCIQVLWYNNIEPMETHNMGFIQFMSYYG